MRSILMETIYIVLRKGCQQEMKKCIMITVIKNGVSEVILMNRQGVVVYTDLNKGEVTKTTLRLIVNK